MVPWGRFSYDPRRGQNADLRATDQDRDVVTDVLAEGFADGRLSRDEFDQRTADAAGAKTLGDLSPILSDLVPVVPMGPKGDLVSASPDDLRDKAVKRYEAARRGALSTMLLPSVVTFIIWFATGFGGGGWHPNFPWFLFVVMGTGINLIRVLVHKEDIVEEERVKLEKKQRKALEPGKDDQGESD